MTGDDATLICRPRRFGKTLNLDTRRRFLSTEFAGRGEELFGNLEVWAASSGERGLAPERIRTYGIAFQGKDVLVG